MYKSGVRPAMFYKMETVAVTERQMEKMKAQEFQNTCKTLATRFLKYKTHCLLFNCLRSHF